MHHDNLAYLLHPVPTKIDGMIGYVDCFKFWNHENLTYLLGIVLTRKSNKYG